MSSDNNEQLEKVLKSLSSLNKRSNIDIQKVMEKAMQMENDRLRDIQSLLNQQGIPLQALSGDSGLATVLNMSILTGLDQDSTDQTEAEMLEKADKAIQDMLNKLKKD